MAFRLSRQERAGDGIRRIALEQIHGALDELKSKKLTSAEKVHQVRKHCKKLRALVRLTRSSLGQEYHSENAWFRDTARPLSGARDAHTMQKTLSVLSHQFRSRFSAQACRKVQRQLQQPDGSHDERVNVQETLSTAARRLKAARSRVEAWCLDTHGFDAVQNGLERTYQAGHTAMQDAGGNPSEATFHEWRKHVKYHWYHCRLLCGMWPEILQARRREVHRLAEALGDDHDLAVLSGAIQDQPSAVGGRGRRHRLLALIRQQRQRLEADSSQLGQRLFAETPAAFVDRFRAYWTVWKHPHRTIRVR